MTAFTVAAMAYFLIISIIGKLLLLLLILMVSTITTQTATYKKVYGASPIALQFVIP
jgi:hypothetical protein